MTPIEEAIRAAVKAGIELAFVRSFPESESENQDLAGAAEDALQALQGIGCCDEMPAKEWTALVEMVDRAHAEAIESAAKHIEKEWPAYNYTFDPTVADSIRAISPALARLQQQKREQEMVLEMARWCKDHNGFGTLEANVVSCEVAVAATCAAIVEEERKRK